MSYVVDAERIPVLMSDAEVEHRVARPLPTSAAQLAGHASGVVVEGLTAKSPWMLGIVMLNIIGIASAVYFLNLLISGQQQHLQALMETQNRQQTEIIKMHEKEFDALLTMANRETAAAPVPPPPAVPAPTRR